MNRDCNWCNRRSSAPCVVWPTIIPGAKLLVVGEFPSREESLHGRCFSGRGGMLLREQLHSLGIDSESEVSYAYVAQCGGTKPTKKQLDACAPNLWRAVRQAWQQGTRMVVAAGAAAYKQLMGQNAKVTEDSGKHKYTCPPQEVWHALQMDEFAIANGIPFPPEESAFDATKLKQQAYRSVYVEPLFERGLVLEEPPQIPVVPAYNPNAFLYENKRQDLFKLTQALRSALKWSGFLKDDAVEKDYKSIFASSEAIEYMDCCIQMHEQGEIPFVALDLETVGSDDDPIKGALKPFVPGGKIITINLSHKAHFARVIYMHHPEAAMTLNEQRAVVEKVRELLARVPVAGANLKFDLHWLRFKYGVRKWTIAHDTQLMNYAMYLGTEYNDLKTLTARHLQDDAGYESDLENFLESLPKAERHYDNVPSDRLTFYAGHDVDVIWQLVPILIQKLKSSGQWKNYHDFLIHPYDAFIAMEQNGARIDPKIVSELKTEYEERVASINTWFQECSPFWEEWRRRRCIAVAESRKKYIKESCKNRPISLSEIQLNFGSAQQVAELLFSIMKLPTWGEPGKPQKALMHIFPEGVPTTGVEAVENILEGLHNQGETGPRIELLEKLLQFRKDSKILSFYLKKAFKHCPVTDIPDWWEDRHTLDDCRNYEAELYEPYCQSARYNLTRARTGRTTSSEPNAQQIAPGMRRMYPARDLPSEEAMLEWGLDPKLNLRRLIANFDVGQAELRMAAVASQDPDFLAIMRDPNRDLHKEVAALAHGKSVEDVTKGERRDAKAIVFGTLFGRGAPSVAAQLKIPTTQAEGIQKAFFALMPGFASWIDARHNEAATTLRVVTPTQRVRDLTMYVNQGERDRRSVNTPIQGGASDLTLWATGWVHKDMQRLNLRSLLWAFVHDSIVLDCFPQEIERLMRIAGHWFMTATPQYFDWYNVPLVLEFEFGLDWASQVPAEYDARTRQFRLEATPNKLQPVFNVFKPLLKDVELDPEWVQKASHVNEQGDLDPKPVWVCGTFE